MLAVPMLVLATGCTVFHENHYFESRSKTSGRATNYIRLEVHGFASLSKARYVAGYYDERAVDFFFNEIKAAAKPEDIATVFDADLKNPGTNDVLVPLSPKAENGALVLLLSTNAKAVVDSIGQFAENQVAADAITNLLNRDRIAQARQAQASAKATADRADAVSKELSSLFERVPTSDTPDRDETIRAYLRVLNAISAAVGDGQVFTTLDAAEKWVARLNTDLGDRQ